MAEAVARIRGKEIDPSMTFSSAGVAASSSGRINTNAFNAIKKRYGVEFAHTPTQLTRDTASSYDCIAAMNGDIASYAASVIGVPREKILLLSRDIPDPYGASQEVYDKCLEVIEAEVLDLISTLKGSKK